MNAVWNHQDALVSASGWDSWAKQPNHGKTIACCSRILLGRPLPVHGDHTPFRATIFWQVACCSRWLFRRWGWVILCMAGCLHPLVGVPLNLRATFDADWPGTRSRLQTTFLALFWAILGYFGLSLGCFDRFWAFVGLTLALSLADSGRCCSGLILRCLFLVDGIGIDKPGSEWRDAAV